MADVLLKRGQTARIPFTILDAVNAPYNLTGQTVRLVVVGDAGRLERVGTIDAPATLGTGFFDIVPADYAILRPGPYFFEVWSTSALVKAPVFSGTLVVVDVPQVSP